MKRGLSTLLLVVIMIGVAYAQENVTPVKNIIIMIPDGTSPSVYSATRWYKNYNNMGKRLNVDPYICGTVTTFSSDAPIGDSAPTTSTYVNGHPAQAGNISIYPEATAHDLFPVDANRSLQPATTLLEAMKLEQGKSTGVVVTSQFCHATPADATAHHYNRSNYAVLAEQMAAQNLNVVFGGGTKYISENMRRYFRKNGTTLIENDKKAFLNSSDDKVWAIFGERAVPYDLDRDTTLIPSLAEMTGKAIELLNRNKKGFFLLVEGSKVDWAAHDNDAVGIITEFKAFDDAIGVAMEFAKKDGETLVVVLSDHCNSGFSIGRNSCKNYTKLTIDELFGMVSKYKKTGRGLEEILLNIAPNDIKTIFNQYTEIDLTNEELERLLGSKNYKKADASVSSNNENMYRHIMDIMNDRTCFGFTTYGHTGGEVLLAAYHPKGELPVGNRYNFELHDYLYKASGLQTPLVEFTDKLFVKHTDVFKGYNYSIDKTDKEIPTLIVKKGRKTLRVKAFSSEAELNGKTFDLGSVVVYIDKNDTFYLPKNIIDQIL